jgi:parallel beta-helix repeat protein
VLDHTWIGYGGAWYGNDKSNLYLNTSNVTIRDSVIAWSFEKGIAIAHLDPAYPLGLTGNTFLNNMQWAVYAKPDGSWADVLLTGNSSSGSSWNGFGIEGTITGTVTFSTTASFPFMAEQEVAVAANSTLTLTPGTAFKFYGKALTIDGRLLARGAVADPVILTSFRDDAHGGNANGDDIPPEIGNWSGLVINGSGSVLDHTWIGYGGAWYGAGQANLTLAASGVSVANSVITSSFNRGIVVDGAAPSILGNQLYGNQVGIYTLNGALPIVRGNEIRNNSLTGLANADLTVPVDATGNWWGATSGPYHPTLNAAGTGNAVSDGVTFDPWYGEFEWVAPYTAVVHGAPTLAWQVFGRDQTGLTASVTVRGAGDWQSLGSGLPPSGNMAWDTQALADGSYDLRVQFYDASQQMLAERIRRVLVLNSPGVTWHAGATGASESWAAGTVHVLADRVIVPSGAQVTVQPGAVVKAATSAGVQIANGGSLHALGSAASPIVFTSLADDTASGDTNADGAATQPQPGDWLGITPFGSGQANLNQYTELRYAQAQHAGTLAQNAVWTKNLLHVVGGEVIVPNGVTLTLEPGAIVKFAKGLGITAQAGGRLVAQGALAEPVQLTSLRDDTVGGDTNRDGALTGPAAGDWRGLLVDGGQAALDHATLSYGGRPASGVWDSSAAAISARNGGGVTLANSLIREPFYEGLIAWGSGDVTFSNCVIAGADRGVNADGAAVVRLTNCTLDDNRIGVWGHGGTLQVVNTIIAHSLEAGLENALGSPLTWRYNDVWSATGANYFGVPDPTGQNGNLSADPRLKNPGVGDYRLTRGSPTIDAADGSVAPATDILSALRYDDPAVVNSGIQTAGGAYADMGAYEFVATAQSNIDLVVTAVHGPTAAVAGQQAALTWTVANHGSEAAVGPWHDRVALLNTTSNPPTSLLAGDVLVGAGLTLGPGQTVEFATEVRVPGGVQGDYHWQVETNAQAEVFEGVNQANNATASPDPVALDVPALVLGGTPLSGNFAAAGQALWFRLAAPANQDLVVELNSAANDNLVDLYAAENRIPSWEDYDFRQAQDNTADPSLFLPRGSAQTYYLLAMLRSSPTGGGAFTIGARTLGYGISSVSPAQAGDNGWVTLALRGGGLEPDTAFELVGPTGEVITTTGVIGLDTTLVEATFNLTGRARGGYAARVKGPAGTATLPAAVEVVAGVAPGVWANLVGPSVIRTGREAVYQVQYGNAGNVDAPMTQVELAVPDGLTIEGYDDVAGSYAAPGAGVHYLNLYSPLLRPGEIQELALKVSAVNPGSHNLQLLADVIPYGLGDVYRRIDPPEVTSYDILSSAPDHISFIRHVSDGSGLHDSSFEVRLTPLTGPITSTMVYTEDAQYAHWAFTTTVTLNDLALDDLALNDLALDAALAQDQVAVISARIPIENVRPPRAAASPEPELPRSKPRDWTDFRYHVTKCLRREGFLSSMDEWDLNYRADESEAAYASIRAFQEVLLENEMVDRRERYMDILRQIDIKGKLMDDWSKGILDMGYNQATLNNGQWNGVDVTCFLNERSRSSCLASLFKSPRVLECLSMRCNGGSPQNGSCKGSSNRPGSTTITAAGSLDPNDKSGNQGAGAAHFVLPAAPLGYSIAFENMITATAPAQTVIITDMLDSSKLDLATFTLGAMRFGDTVVTPPAGRSQFATEVDLRPAKNLLVQIEAGLDRASGVATWRFTSLDPATRSLPEDPLAGFLPPNADPPAGQGSVFFAVQLKPSLATGAQVRNGATIVFDENEAILTPEWLNTIDRDPPSSQVQALPARSMATFDVGWTGQDAAGGSGVGSYDLYVSTDGGDFSQWGVGITGTQTTFTGEPGHIYAFYTVAVDKVGHHEAAPAVADAVTETQYGNYLPLVVGKR